MRTQRKLLGVHRSTAAYQPVARKPQDARLCHLLDELYLRDPCVGTRLLVAVLQRDHVININRKKLQRVRRAMGMEALERAKLRSGCVPEMFNTDQGSQFTSQPWCEKLTQGRRISMNGKGRWMDDLFIERLCRRLKYKDIYLRGYATVDVLESGVSKWMKHYNTWRPHFELL
jgi:transposase InsO family protein